QTVCGIENKGRLVILFPAQIPGIGKGCQARSGRALGLWSSSTAGHVPAPCTLADQPAQGVFCVVCEYNNLVPFARDTDIVSVLGSRAAEAFGVVKDSVAGQPLGAMRGGGVGIVHV